MHYLSTFFYQSTIYPYFFSILVCSVFLEIIQYKPTPKTTPSAPEKWSSHYALLPATLNQLPGSTNQELFEKKLCNQL